MHIRKKQNVSKSLCFFMLILCVFINSIEMSLQEFHERANFSLNATPAWGEEEGRKY